MEYDVLKRLQGKQHVCRLHGCGRTDQYSYVVMSLVGETIADLKRAQKQERFSYATGLRLTIQVLESLQDLHGIGILDRDVKPSNFAMGRHPHNKRIVYMLDFGLARKFINERNEIRTPRAAAGFRGTVRYASLNTHNQKEMGRHDDIWSLYYMTIEYLTGALPWRKENYREKVKKAKEKVENQPSELNKFLDKCPAELHQFHDYLKPLNYLSTPPYDKFYVVLAEPMTRLDVTENTPYDWKKGILKFSLSDNRRVRNLSGQMR